jgi:hypothetical protein|tara:strand:+ start:194 stop:445 length:252 start_codon:yes stop_codon:yes gene_type:complete
MKKLLLILLLIKTNITYPQVPVELDYSEDLQSGIPMRYRLLFLILILVVAFFFIGYLYGIEARDKQVYEEKMEAIKAREAEDK